MGKLLKQEHLQGVNQELQYALPRAVLGLPFDVLVVQGLRSVEEQEKQIALGRSWVKDASKAPHVVGLAVDLVPFIDGRCDWKDVSKFDRIYTSLNAELRKLGHELTTKISRDRNHFQLLA
jgi:hypothetical protein